MRTCSEDIREDKLAEMARQDNPVAMKTLYNRYVRYLTAICSRYIDNEDDVRDVLQDAFLKIFSSIDKFTYLGEGSLKSWLAKVTVNETLRFIKRNGRLDFVSLEKENIDIEDDEPELDNIPISEIHNMIRELKPGYRTIFNLYVFEEKSHKEIASILNIKESTSASQLHRAKAILADKIRKYQTLTPYAR
ncbi:MAG: RNA polymerase sigma factor [Muribaculaceae bacterium]|jgi:RNA polymerase sigma factor (sigma-70 family)|uniref:RNA polymerase sigma factor n=1 Tax=Bacteroidales TaxID=171549 RepID=UPI000F4AD7F5|nr:MULTISPECIES: RNA polymerase sigma factor [Bacteroidales]MBJ2193195.1 RNA polymerase sigma factor [Muribaculaceae bacterium]ROS82275.1 RNA polymerase sigma factor [Muribaculaceae bacterium Isolate-036 (Harlan)]ROT21036.1 RNA polymerase sigma factor [Muribaculaceae bacterium Isolate-114 (HZI)]ROT22289.1 RNA polymerase sigma factor [Muribaculaceae bacterium Isolate-113 (HZI)]MBJ2197843.1 RNA polymerase sigma factor [Muribaculaceae bacterium]